MNEGLATPAIHIKIIYNNIQTTATASFCTISSGDMMVRYATFTNI